MSGTDTYDFENRLIVRTRADGSTVNITYDADGNRIAKNILNVSGATVSSTTWLVDTNNLTGYAQVLEERFSSGGSTTLKVYTYGNSLISVARSFNLQPSTFNYFSFDGHGNVRELTDSTGAITDRYDYDAFGNLVYVAALDAATGKLTSQSPGSWIQNPGSNHYLYCGEQYDQNLGLYFLRARYLNPDSGRFWSMDSYAGVKGDPGSLHKYLYANVDPVLGSDPSGYFTLVETETTQDVDSQLNRVAVPNAKRIVSLKIYNVYYGLQLGIPGHSAIFVGTKVGDAGWIFDVLPRQAAGYFDAVDGVIRRRPSTLEAFKRYCPTIHRKFTEFSNVEFIAWILALRLVDAEDRSETPVSYQMAGFEALFNGATNCHKWAFKAVLSAVVVTRGQLKFD